MAWDYGTITDANPADALMDKIEGCMTDPAWTFEEQLTAGEMGGGGGIGRIWDNSNGFHLAIEVYETSHWVRLRLAEGYNAATNKCVRPAMSGVLAVGADYSYGNGTEYDWTVAATVGQGSLNTTGFTYAISATANYLYFAVLVGTTATPAYAGKFDSLMASDPGPFCAWTIGGVPYHTRVPNTTGSPNFTGSTVAHTGTSGTPAAYDTTHNAIVLSRLRVTNRAGTDPYRGLMKGAVSMVTNASYAFGDELDVGGSPKYKVLMSGYAIEMV